MIIGIDMSPLQGPHRMRGIGATVMHYMNTLSKSERADNEYVLYFDSKALDSSETVLKMLELADMRYTVVLNTRKVTQFSITSKLPRIVAWPIKAIEQLSNSLRLYVGDNRLAESKVKLDVFLQFDPLVSLPASRKTKKALVLYDLIPYVLSDDYMWTYKIARRKGCSRKGALNHGIHRWIYAQTLKQNARRATTLLAISKKTKNDFVNFLGIDAAKITVTKLGVTTPEKLEYTSQKNLVLHQYEETSWGYMKKPLTLKPETKFLLFMGGVDRRRKLVDLVTAFNHLRAQGHDIKLVLAGDTLQGPESIPIPETRLALEQSSYNEDIIYMGFVSEKVKRLLYAHAVAFVYPSVYEGFGLPVLEALAEGTPVICYKNDAVFEAAGDLPMYAGNYTDIIKFTEDLLGGKSELNNEKFKDSARIFTKAQSWEKTTRAINRAIRVR